MDEIKKQIKSFHHKEKRNRVTEDETSSATEQRIANRSLVKQIYGWDYQLK